jgi:alginate O-acetyltransferase complex protein AlgI
MIFTTYWFVLFAFAFFPLYWLARPRPVRLGLLLVACFVFHAHFAGAAGVLPILVLALITYLAGLSRHRWALIGAMILSVLALIFYKYTHWLTLELLASVNPAWGQRLHDVARSAQPATPPLAVSFFTFEFVHYLYDVLKGEPSIRSPAKFAAFTFFFPSLVAGPIKRYQPFLASLDAGLARVEVHDVKAGALRVATGFVKKVVLADNLTAAIAYWQPHFAELPLAARWLFCAALGLRILLDFSGYSDMAIGLAQMAGIRVPENFNWPYAATHLADFWQRWHISLSSWIRDYVYIPLGGNRHGLARKVANGWIAFGLCGLWHGAAWNFVFWGLYHGAGLAVSGTYRTLLGAPGRALGAVFDRVPLLSWAVTMFFVFVGWLYFFYPMPAATTMLRLLFTPSLGSPT